MTEENTSCLPVMRNWYQVGRAFSFSVGCLYFSTRVFGVRHVPRFGGLLMAGNHQSALDPMLQTYAVPRECHYVARDTLFKNWAFAKLIRSFNAFPIKRDTADMSAVKETLRRLAQGAAVLVYPEGTRTTDGLIHDCQPGIMSMARKARVPIVPVVVEGAFDAWPRHSKIPWPSPVWVEYGEPLSLEWVVESDPRAAAVELSGIMRGLHNQLRRRMGREEINYTGIQNSEFKIQKEPGSQRSLA